MFRVLAAVMVPVVLTAACASNDVLPALDAGGDAVLRDSGVIEATDATPDAAHVGGDAHADAAPVPAFRVAGLVRGLLGSGLVLRNGDNDASVAGADGGDVSFSFENVPTGAAYAVIVRTQPSLPSQLCTVERGSGSVGSRDVTDVVVSCTTQAFHVDGTVLGLLGTGLVLTDQNGAELSVDAEAPAFDFAGSLVSGSLWSISVLHQPTSPSQTCTPVPASGTIGGAHTAVAVQCLTDHFTVGGTVAGLQAGSPITLHDGAATFTLDANGTFTRPVSVPSGTGYAITVDDGMAYGCDVVHGTGAVGAANVTNVAIQCYPTHTTVAGVDWYFDPELCTENCNAVCSKFGKVPADDAAVFAAQNTTDKCKAISSAFGLGATGFAGSYPHNCIKSQNGLSGRGLTGPLDCSTLSTCPATMRALPLQPRVCDGSAGSARWICGCQ